MTVTLKNEKKLVYKTEYKSSAFVVHSVTAQRSGVFENEDENSVAI